MNRPSGFDIQELFSAHMKRMKSKQHVVPCKLVPEQIGSLTVSLYEGTGFSIPARYQHLVESYQHDPLVQFRLQDSNHPVIGHRGHRFLPYAVLDFDKVQVFVGSVGGTMQNPIWNNENPTFGISLSASDLKAIQLTAGSQRADELPPPKSPLSAPYIKGRLMKLAFPGPRSGYEFDVSRVTELRVDFYLRSPNAPRGSQDIFLGMIKMDPFLEENEPTDGKWFKIQDGTGMVRIKVEYIKSKQAPMDPRGALRNGSYLGPAAYLDQKAGEVYDMMNIKAADLDPVSEAATELNFLIDHPFIIPLTFAIETSDQISLYHPKPKGGQLLYHLQRKRHFDTHESKFYVAEILCAVEYLHNLGIIPCWLKLENIFLDTLGHVLLKDFGFFNLPIRNEDHILKKKPEYPAPELLLGHPCSATADWWTLGVFLYEMLTGLPPFYDEDSQEMRRKILHEVDQFPESLAPDAKDILSKLLERDPNQRLGAGGASEIKSHAFFQGIDWNMVYERRIDPDYKPTDLVLSKVTERDALISPRFSGLTFPRRTYHVELDVIEILKNEESNLEEYKIGERVEINPSTRIQADPGEIIGLPGKTDVPKSQTLSDQASYPRLPGLITIPIEEDDGWELIWEEDSQEFCFYNRFSGTKDLVNLQPSSILAQESDSIQRSNLPSREQKQVALEEALRRGNTRVISQLLEYDINLNKPLPYRETTLQWAVNHENVELIEFLLGKGANPNVARREAIHVLVSAVKKGHPGMVKALVSKSDRVYSTMALNQAVQQQDSAIVRILLENGVCCDFEDGDRPRPQRVITHSGAMSSCPSPEPYTAMDFIPPLVHAIYRSNTHIARLLLESGANVNSAFHDLFPFYNLRDLAKRTRERRRTQITCGRAIQLAMEQRDQGMVQLLLDFGADINLESPIWLYHECPQIPRSEYLRVTASLRAAVVAR